MASRPLPPELGARLRTVRPLPWWVAPLVALVPALVGAGVPATFVQDPPWEPVLISGAIIWLGFLGIVAEPLGYRHHVHEAGIVSESFRPFPRRIIPFHTVDPASISPARYERTPIEIGHMGARRHRQVPGIPTLRLRGLRVDRATALARGTATWNAAPYERVHGGAQREAEPVEWLLAWPHPERDLDQLRELAARHDHPWQGAADEERERP